MQSENISTPIYVEYDQMYQSRVCVQEFQVSFFVSGLDIQPDLVEYAQHTCFYIAVLSIIVFFLQWPSRADRLVNLDTSI